MNNQFGNKLTEIAGVGDRQKASSKVCKAGCSAVGILFSEFPVYICSMEQMLQLIDSYKTEISSLLPDGAQSTENYRIRFLGSKGIVKSLFAAIKDVPSEQKKAFGQILNEFKQLAEAKYEELKSAIQPAGPAAPSEADSSLPGNPLPLGSRHPISLVRNQICALSFNVARPRNKWELHRSRGNMGRAAR